MVECTPITTILLAHDPLSSLAYSMITHTPPVAGNLSIKTLVARQRPTNTFTYKGYITIMYTEVLDILLFQHFRVYIVSWALYRRYL